MIYLYFTGNRLTFGSKPLKESLYECNMINNVLPYSSMYYYVYPLKLKLNLNAFVEDKLRKNARLIKNEIEKDKKCYILNV
jgi:hypothetical protein